MIIVLRRLCERVSVAVKILRIYKNYPAYFLNRFGLCKSRFLVLSLRNGIRYKIQSRRFAKGDYYVLNESWVHGIHGIAKDYFKKSASGGEAIVLDIGAHIGAFSIFAASQAGNVRVFSFEPMEENLKMLRENIALNKLENRITPVGFAVCSASGKRNIYLSYGVSGQHTLYPALLEQSKNYHPKRAVVEINCLTLKDFMDYNNLTEVDVVKMDCEGAEYEILYSTPKDYLGRIKCFSIETHDIIDGGVARAGYGKEDLKIFLREHGFHVSETHKGVLWATT